MHGIKSKPVQASRNGTPKNGQHSSKWSSFQTPPPIVNPNEPLDLTNPANLEWLEREVGSISSEELTERHLKKNEVERKRFSELTAEERAEYEALWLVISGTEIVGTTSTMDAAFEMGYTQLKGRNFLVGKVSPAT